MLVPWIPYLMYSYHNAVRHVFGEQNVESEESKTLFSSQL